MIYCIKCGTEIPDEALFCPSCGTPVVKTKKTRTPAEKTSPATDSGSTLLNVNKIYGHIDLQHLPEGHVIDGRYRIIRKLGQGSFGAVYLAWDKELETNKALKIIPEALSNDREAMLSLRKEAAIMVKLNHKNIVRVYDFHHTGGMKYIDMEYVEGKSLADLKLKKPGKKFTEKETKLYALQIAEGLSYAHRKKVIHKDIKPQNIMLSGEGEIKIMDFGIAETVHSSMSRLKNTGTSGTLVYMSPEQLIGENVGREADIYSLGATLYELLTGNPPFYQGDITYQIINKKPLPLTGVSPQMNNIVLKCLEKDRKQRFADCEGLMETINNKKNFSTSQKSTFTEPPLVSEKKSAGIDFIEMVFVKGGTFQMGSNKGFFTDRKPVHSVTLDDFYIGKYEVTQKQWKAIMGNNLSYNKGCDDCPVEKVSWNDVQKFIKKLNEKTGKYYRLPTEAEWEYAARGGVKSRGYQYAGNNDIEEVAWYDGNSGNKTHPVGQKKANELGIYDMSGNVWEWCSDWYSSSYYGSSPQNNPQGPSSGSFRVYRGGSWFNFARHCRVAFRFGDSPGLRGINLGFRLVLVP